MRSQDYNLKLSEPVQRNPKIAGFFAKFLRFFDYVFDRAYGSEWNPLYRSGTLSVALLGAVIVSGIYLLFFYKLSSPYDSMASIQSQVWLGRWIRAFHRYASDLTVVFVGFHFFRMAVQGKTWGPRLLAWMSGVVLLFMLFLSGWTGYILVWDQQGQSLALQGARILDLFPLLAEPLSRAFSGVTVISSSFFFMNLFLHVAIPLGMIFAIWLHTSRLARSVWFPQRNTLFFLLAVILIISIVIPAPLGLRADLLRVSGDFPIDIWFSFWIPLSFSKGTYLTGMLWVLFAALVFLAPFYWKPNKTVLPLPSQHDEEKCEGCTQCVQDCPFEAITMVPRTLGIGSLTVARVDVSLCVSCGICSGSCTQFAIGPPGRSGRDQLLNMKKSMSEVAPSASLSRVTVLHCRNNPTDQKILNSLNADRELRGRIVPCAVECVGAVHPAIVTSLLNNFSDVLILGCPESLCLHREGRRVAEARLFHGQSPGLPSRVDTTKIKMISGSDADLEKIHLELKARLGIEPPLNKNKVRMDELKKWLKCASFSLVFTACVAGMSALRVNQGVYSAAHSSGSGNDAVLRLSWRLPGQVIEVCRNRSADELQALPLHMRQPKKCETKVVNYRLQYSIDGKTYEPVSYHSKGVRGDRPILVDQDIPISSGLHQVSVQFLPEEKGPKTVALNYVGEIQFKLGMASLLTYDSVKQEFYLSKAASK